MLKVNIIKTIEGNGARGTLGIHTEGHADYAGPGFDIVCAACSSITEMLLNAIESMIEHDFVISCNQRLGLIHAELESKDVTDITQVLFDAYEEQIKNIAEDYPRNVTVRSIISRR